MPLELGLWGIGGAAPRGIQYGHLDLESRRVTVANLDWTVLERQVRTTFASFVDLLLLDSQGNPKARSGES